MRNNFTPEDLQNKNEFILLDTVSYKQLKPFVIKAIQKKSKLITIYSIIQLLALITATLILGILIYQSFKQERLTEPLKWYLIAIGCSVTIVIPVHELLHAATFLILGKKNIGFGAQFQKFIFYAEADRQVMDKREMTIVAFAPLVMIGLLSLIFCMINISSPISYLGVGIFLIHFLFCAGDMAIVAYFSQKEGIYSFDDRKEKASYFYQKREHLN